MLRHWCKCCPDDKPDHDADEEEWNAAICEKLLGANRGSPPVSRALCPVSRYPMRYSPGVMFGGVRECARSGRQVSLSGPHFECDQSGTVVCLGEGPRVYVDHQYDLTYVKSRRHTIQEVFGPGDQSSHGPKIVIRTKDFSFDEGKRVASRVLLRVEQLAEDDYNAGDFHDEEWLVGVNAMEMTARQAEALAAAARDVLASQPTLVEARVPCVVFGDTHGQLRDILLMFREYGWPGKPDGRDFVFNGDFVDRGAHQVEVAMLVLALKVLFPTRVWLLRGNHEDKSVNARYGFVHQCNQCYGVDGPRVFDAFHDAFDMLPLGCLVGGEALVLHGGIGTGKWDLHEMMHFPRPITHTQINEHPFIFNTLWSDPIEDDDPHGQNNFGLHPSPRGKHAVKFGWDVTYEFCKRNNISMVIRSHQAKRNGFGFDVMHEMMLVRVFTARDYDRHRNDGAILLIEDLCDGVLKVRPQVLRSMYKAYQEEEDESLGSSDDY